MEKILLAPEVRLRELIINLLNSKDLEKKLKGASLKDVSSFFKAAAEILNSLNKGKPLASKVTSLEDLTAYLNEQDVGIGISILRESDNGDEREVV